MVMQAAYNPASVHVRVGKANEAFDQFIWEGELEKAGNVLGSLRTYAAVFMTDRELQDYDSRPGYLVGDNRTEAQVARDMENRRVDLLKILRDRQGVFARAAEEDGDASTLEIPIPE